MRERKRAAVRARLIVSAVAVAGLLLGGAAGLAAPATADTAPASGTPATVSADPLPTVQQNGVVYAQVTVGNVVYATGSFSETWPAGQTDQPGSNETARGNLLAYNITTGALVTGFAPGALNAQGLGIAASPDGKTIYVVGDFTKVGTAAANHIAAFNASTGALVTSFTASVSAEASAVAATSSAVYVGGNFFQAGGKARTRLAAFSPAGALLSWAPTADDGQVSSLVVAPGGSRLVAGGRFTTLDGQTSNGMGALDATSGAIEPWAINTAVKDGDGATSSKCGITNLSTDGTNIYGGGFAYGCGNFEGTFAANPTTGAIVWINDCHGDTYSTLPEGKVLYVASHAHDCTAIGQFPNNTPPGNNQRATAFSTVSTGGTDVGPDAYGWNYNGDPDTALLHWFPTLAPGKVTGQDQAAWSVTGNANYVAYGGEFPTVNGSAQQGLVRFAVSSIAPDKVGPIATTSSTTLVPTVSSTTYGQVDLTWKATWDRDNANLTYTVLRDGAAVGTVTQASNFWQLPTVSYTDKGLTPGTSHTYRIRVTDPSGNSIGSGTSAPVTVSSSGTAPASAAPTASFTSSCSQRTCAFDAAKSTAVDGSVASYAWTFGDGTTGSGATASHTYNGDGKHAVALTVTDSAGSTSAAVSHSVTTTTLVAQDTFAKSVKSGWGTSGVGGSWSRSGCKSMSVSGRHGTLVAARAKDCSTWLPQVKRSSTDTAATLRSPSAPKGGLQAAVIGRRISAADDIRLRLEFQHNGNAVATVLQRVGGKTTALSKSVKVEAASHSNGTFRVLLEVTGTSPTTVRAKVWSSGNSQPAAWTLTAKTGTGALQHKGALGFDTYLAQAHNPKSSSLRVSDFSSSTVG